MAYVHDTAHVVRVSQWICAARATAAVLVAGVVLAGCARPIGGGPEVSPIQVSGAPLSTEVAENRYEPVVADLQQALNGVYGSSTWAAPGQHSRAWKGCGGVIGPRAVTVTPGPQGNSVDARGRETANRVLSVHGFPDATDVKHAGPGLILRSRDASGTVVEVTLGTTLNILVVYPAEPERCS